MYCFAKCTALFAYLTLLQLSYKMAFLTPMLPTLVNSVWWWKQTQGLLWWYEIGHNHIPNCQEKKKERKQLEDIGLYSFPFCFVLFLVKSTDSLLTAFRFDYLICPWSHSFIFYLNVVSTELSILATSFWFHMVIGKCTNECIDT